MKVLMMTLLMMMMMMMMMTKKLQTPFDELCSYLLLWGEPHTPLNGAVTPVPWACSSFVEKSLGVNETLLARSFFSASQSEGVSDRVVLVGE